MKKRNLLRPKKHFDTEYVIIDKHVTYVNGRVNLNKVAVMRIIEEANRKWGLNIPSEGSKLTKVESK